MMHPEEAQRLIRAGVKRGVDRRGELKPYKITHPVKVELTLYDTVVAEVAAYLPGIERPHGNQIAFNARDMLEASRIMRAVASLHP